MKCPQCESLTDVVDSRVSLNGAIRRRRVCRVNNHRFTTYETVKEESYQIQLEILESRVDAIARYIMSACMSTGEFTRDSYIAAAEIIGVPQAELMSRAGQEHSFLGHRECKVTPEQKADFDKAILQLIRTRLKL